MTNASLPGEKQTGEILVIGVGQPLRGDDGAGPEVVQGLRRYFQAQPQPAIRLTEAGGGLVDLLESGPDYARVILVDAVVTGKPPGTLHRWDVTHQSLPASLRACSTHGFDLAGAIELNRALGRLPRSLVIYGIEATQFETGADLSPAVKAGVAATQALLLAELVLINKPRPN